jgi:hypothetical protein
LGLCFDEKLSLVVSLGDNQQMAKADHNDKPKKGNNCQCRKLQKSFPEEIQNYEGCHDTFTRKDHDEPDEPLP